MGRQQRQKLPAALLIGGSTLIFATFVFVAPAMPRLNPATLDFPTLHHTGQVTTDLRGALDDGTAKQSGVRHGSDAGAVPVLGTSFPTSTVRDDTGVPSSDRFAEGEAQSSAVKTVRLLRP